MKTLPKAYSNPRVGCYVDASTSSADYLNERIISLAEDYGFPAEPLPGESSEDYGQILNEIADDAVEFLNECETRSYMAWSVEDNSLFLAPCVENAREDVGFVSGGEDCDPEDSDYPAADYRGEWLHINERGNCTLYVRGEDGNDKEIWSVC